MYHKGLLTLVTGFREILTKKMLVIKYAMTKVEYSDCRLSFICYTIRDPINIESLPSSIDDFI